MMKKALLIASGLLSAGVAGAQTCAIPQGHISSFTSVQPSAQPDSMRIPSTHTFQMLTQKGQPYTNTAEGTMKGTFDFTGYVPINGSSKKGYIDLNHEEGSWPASGVSVLDVRFNDTTKLWEVTNTKPVDFSGVAGTGRNCSGGVTPWGTSVTSEETLPTADANGDGYQDIGWNVEINPVTRSIVDYNSDGTPDKIWKAGRMSHENVVISNDSIILYEANDENPGYVWKYVLTQKGKLNDGTLYVLKMNGGVDTATTGSWVVVPNGTPTECNNVRSAATALGASNFNSLEDVEISPLDGKIYFTSKSSSRVYRFKDNGTTVSEAGIFVGNANSEYVIVHENGIAVEQWRDGNDNLAFDELGNLYVIQDGGRNHIWMVTPCHTQQNPDVKLFMVTPAGSEPTGLTFSPDHKFMYVSIQHPDAANATIQVDAAGKYVRSNKDYAVVIARREILGIGAIDTTSDTTTAVGHIGTTPTFELAQLYPNPTSSDVTLDINSRVAQAAVLRIYSMTGSLIMSKEMKLSAGASRINLGTSTLAAGTYNVIINTRDGVINTRFLKQ